MSNEIKIHVNDNDLPGMFNLANYASVTAQESYLRLFKWNLIIMVIVAFISIFIDGKESSFATPIGLLLVISLIITAIIRITKKERVWFDGRAVAESIKTISWKYMVGSDIFPITMLSSECDKKFIVEISKVLAERKDLAKDLGTYSDIQPQITAKMREIRSLQCNERKEVYLNCRIREQKNWYSKKSRLNRDAETRWFLLVFVSQGLALALVFLHSSWPIVPLGGTGIFSTLVTAFLAWLQVKQHQGLSQSYGLAAQELSIIEDLIIHITTDEQLSEYVSNAENAISREHTMWVARRDN